eukprot:337650-Hanusia_phi.AAC.1
MTERDRQESACPGPAPSSSPSRRSCPRSVFSPVARHQLLLLQAPNYSHALPSRRMLVRCFSHHWTLEKSPPPPPPPPPVAPLALVPRFRSSPGPLHPLPSSHPQARIIGTCTPASARAAAGGRAASE